VKRLRFNLQARAPFRLDLTAWALRRRPRNCIDRWDGSWYSRAERPQIECVCVCFESALKSERMGAVIEHLLGLSVDLSDFERLARSDSRLRSLAARFSGFHPPRFPTVFEAAVNAVCCQQLSIEAGLEMLSRLSLRTGTMFKNGAPCVGPPEPHELARLSSADLFELGFSRHKARALLGLARIFAASADPFGHLAGIDHQSAVNLLMQLKGIGRWSAEYILLRGVGNLSVFPGDDVAAAKGLHEWLGIGGSDQRLGYDEIHAALQRWAPFQGLIYFHLLLANLARRGWLDSALPLPMGDERYRDRV